jgi:peptidoglycan/LPS O-acetylase OafA/YrhL
VPVSGAISMVIVSCLLARPALTSVWWVTHLPFPFEDYLVVLPVGLLLIAAAGADLEARKGWPRTRASVFLGEASFAFYLVHYLTTRVLVHVFGWGHTWTGIGGALPLVVTLTASLGLAVALHELVELPMQRRLREPRTSPWPSLVATTGS